MRALYPAAALDHVVGEIRAAREAAERNAAPDGVGWTDIHMIEAPAAGYDTLGLSLSAMAQAIAPCLPEVSVFEVGGHPGNPFYRKEGLGTCFGFDHTAFIKLEGQDDLLAAIWFDIGPGPDNQKTAMAAAFQAIDAIAPCVVADYWMDAAGLVGDPAFMQRYWAAVA